MSAAAILKIEDMPYLSNGLIDLHKVWQGGTKCNNVDGRHFE